MPRCRVRVDVDPVISSTGPSGESFRVFSWLLKQCGNIGQETVVSSKDVVSDMFCKTRCEIFQGEKVPRWLWWIHSHVT